MNQMKNIMTKYSFVIIMPAKGLIIFKYKDFNLNRETNPGSLAVQDSNSDLKFSTKMLSTSIIIGIVVRVRIARKLDESASQGDSITP